jgi:hypothetical protein
MHILTLGIFFCCGIWLGFRIGHARAQLDILLRDTGHGGSLS